MWTWTHVQKNPPAEASFLPCQLGSTGPLVGDLLHPQRAWTLQTQGPYFCYLAGWCCMAESSGGDKPFVYTEGGVGPDPQHQAGSQVFCQETLLGLEGSVLWAHVTPNWLGTTEMGSLRAQVDCQCGRGGSVHLGLRQAGLCQEPHPSGGGTLALDRGRGLLTVSPVSLEPWPLPS